MKSSNEVILILPDIRSAQNVGAIFRTADAAGVSKIYLTGYTPCPIDRFGRARSDISKASLGAEKCIPWEYKKILPALVRRLRRDGYEIIALEQNKKSVDYKKYKPTKKFAIILGNEVDGINEKVLGMCDAIIEIGMKGEKESLNVSVATGVALFRILNI